MSTALTLAALLAVVAASPARAEPSRSGPYSIELTDEHGRVLPTFSHEGRTYVLGARGDRYLVRVRNGSWQRAEVVVSVDGRDVLDGEPSAFSKRGYLVEPYGEVTIDGFRLSDAAVAAFRFSSVGRSYAARMGDARDVGVIGVAVFPERTPPPRPLPLPEPRPWWRGGSSDEAEDDDGPTYHTQEAPAPPPSAAPAESGRRDAPADALAGASRAPEAKAEKRSSQGADHRPGLGTEFGERRESHVTSVPFFRASTRPAAVLSLRYDDRRGLAALGIDVDGRHAADDRWLRERADPFRRDHGYAKPPPGWSR